MLFSRLGEDSTHRGQTDMGHIRAQEGKQAPWSSGTSWTKHDILWKQCLELGGGKFSQISRLRGKRAGTHTVGKKCG